MARGTSRIILSRWSHVDHLAHRTDREKYILEVRFEDTDLMEVGEPPRRLPKDDEMKVPMFVCTTLSSLNEVVDSRAVKEVTKKGSLRTVFEV